MGSETCSKSSGESCSLTFRAKKSCLMLNLRVLWASWSKRGVYFSDSHARREHFEYLWVRNGLRITKLWPFYWTPVLYMAVLERISFSRDGLWRATPKFYVLHSGDIVSTYILTDARNALLLLAVTHVRYGIPDGKNKENKAYRRLIFLNLKPNGIPRIIEHVQNETLVLTRRTNVCTHHNISDFLPKECQWIQKLVWKAAANYVLWLSGAKSPA